MSTDIFVDSGFVVDGFVESLTSSAQQHWTDFREYRRGVIPPDWQEIYTAATVGRINQPGSQIRIEGTAVDLHSRNFLQVVGGVLNQRTALIWTAPQQDTDYKDQEILVLFKFQTAYAAGRSLLVLRASGALNAETFYSLAFDISGGNFYIKKRVAGGTLTTLGTVSGRTFIQGGYYWARFKVAAAALAVSVWADGATEPISPDLSVADSSIASGDLGVISESSTETVEVSYFSVGTGGERAPLSAADILDNWISTDEDQLELIYRFEYYDPATDTVGSKWVSTHGRVTAFADYPSNTEIEALLTNAGAITSRLNADSYLEGAATPTFDQIELSNLPDDPLSAGSLDAWAGYSFSGRPIEARIGRRWATLPTSTSDGVLSDIRRYEIVACMIAAQEPAIGKDKVTVPLGFPSDTLLTNPISSYKNRGIPTGVQALTGAGWLSIPFSAAYNVNSYNIYFSLYVPTSGVAGSTFCTISRRITGATTQQWNIILHHASHATLANRLQAIVYDGSNNLIISTSPAILMNQGRFIDVVFSVNAQSAWYIYVDGIKTGGGTLSAIPFVSGAGVEVLTDTSTGCSICDHRIELWASEDDAVSRFSALHAPDSLTLSMHRCDDGLLSTVTDYAPLANHGTLQGVNNTDRAWVPTYQGEVGIAGSMMPMSAGVIFHAPTSAIDSVRNAFRYNDRAKTAGSTLTIRAKGLPLVGGGTDYSEPVSGVADFVGAADQPITFGIAVSVSPDNSSLHVPALIRDDLVSRGAISYSNADLGSFDALRKLLPMEGGYYWQSPPTIADFFTATLGQIGGCYYSDRSQRISSGFLLPTVNPSPYGVGTVPVLEFLGYPNRGIVFAPNSSYGMKQASSYGITCFFKTPPKLIDPSTPTSFSHFPQGMTLVDCSSSTKGYYLGIDGRDGYLIFGAIGVVSVSSSAEFTKLIYTLAPNTWYMVRAVEGPGTTRSLTVYAPANTTSLGTLSETITGSMTAPTNIPLKIGHGPYGSFVGALSYVVGASGAHSTQWVNNTLTSAPVLNVDPNSASSPADRFFISLADGIADLAYDQAANQYGRIQGARWCPRMVLDFTVAGTPTIGNFHRPKPAYQIGTQYKKNFSIINGANVVAGVSASDRVALNLDNVSDPFTSQSIRGTKLNSRDVELMSPLSSAADALIIRDIVRTRIGSSRRFADVAGWYREALKLGMTDEVLVIDARFMPNGLPMRVHSLIQRFNSLSADVGIWG